MSAVANITQRRWPRRFQKFRRRVLRPFWDRVERPLVVGLWLAVIVLGCLGFEDYYAAHGVPLSPWDLIYLTLRLFTLQSGTLLGSLPWELQVARLLAPAVAAYTAIQALAGLFYTQIQLIRVDLMRDHIVVCGLGRKGWLLASSLSARGDQVVGIERDPTSSMVQQCREQGITVLLGDATDPQLLRAARVDRAKHVFAVCGDEGANAEVAVHTRELVGKRRKHGALTCTIHIVDPQLWHLLRQREIGMDEGNEFRLELFNIFDRGARALLDTHPPFSDQDVASDPQPHLLVVGMGRLGESLVVHAARRWHARYTTTGERLRITLIDQEAEEKAQSLCLRHPQLDRVCELAVYQLNVRSPALHRAEFLQDANGCSRVTIVYVCLDDDSLGLATALALHQRLRWEQIPIVVRTAQDAGLATLLGGEDGEAGAFQGLHAFGLLDRTCTPDLLLGGTHEILARALHEERLRYQRSAGQRPGISAVMVPWEELPESLKESRRHQASRMGAKLQHIGCRHMFSLDADTTPTMLEQDEVEELAKIEHELWMRELQAAGWHYAPGPEDLKRKTSPELLPWNELTEEVKDYDRVTAQELPVALAQAGFRIERTRDREQRPEPRHLGSKGGQYQPSPAHESGLHPIPGCVESTYSQGEKRHSIRREPSS